MSSRGRFVRTLVLAALAGVLFPVAAPSAEPEILYPAKVMTRQGRIYHLRDLGHALARGSFVMFDGETEGRIPWRDVDSITFVGNLRHRVGAQGAEAPGTRRVQVRFVDGQERFVNLAIGRVHGHDGLDTRSVDAEDLSVIDFDQVRIAPAIYKSCEHGHVWEQADYRYCPYDGLELVATRLDGGPQ
jgi:hypothetical protein